MTIRPYTASTFRTADSIGFLLKVSHTLLVSSAEGMFQGNDISFMQWIAMQKLREGQAITPGDLCRAMHYDSGALTRMVDQLVTAGYVERHRSVEDRRVVELKLTATGEAKIDQMLPAVVDGLNSYCEVFDEAEFETLTRLLKKLIARICAVSGQPLPGQLK